MPTASINTGMYYNNKSTIVNCGVYTWDLAYQMRPCICSVRSLGKIAQNDCIDYIIVYPGYKVITYADYGYVNQQSIIDNNYGNKIIIRKLANINSAGSLKIYYNGNLIELDGLSSNVTLSTMQISGGQTFTYNGNSLTIT